MGARLAAWEEVSGNKINFSRYDVAENYHRLLATHLGTFRPDAVVHFAEQRAAPYSMKCSATSATPCQQPQRDQQPAGGHRGSGLDTHVVHLGTMGVYGYGTAGMKIPEGYLRVKVETDAR